MQIEVSNGEIVDKFTILFIKKYKITDESKLKNINNEIDALGKAMYLINPDVETCLNLKKINESLWDVEDELRLCEQQERFDDYFITLARSVYKLNDERAAIKKSINIIIKNIQRYPFRYCFVYDTTIDKFKKYYSKEKEFNSYIELRSFLGIKKDLKEIVITKPLKKIAKKYLTKVFQKRFPTGFLFAKLSLLNFKWKPMYKMCCQLSTFINRYLYFNSKN
jgi:hypothetical protein